jgi:alkylation response protein AidB-like acyl-CoA dehydrogenase
MSSADKGNPMNKGGSFLLEPVIGTVFARERFSEEQKEIEQMVRSFAAEQIQPRKQELEAFNRELSLQLMQEAANLGLTAIDIPEAYDGLEQGKTTSALVNEALTRGESTSWVVTFSCHVGIGTLPIVYFGTEEQKKKYLPKLATVEYLSAYALTEPGAGSDALNQKTTARPSDDGSVFVLNGTKQYITNGGWADLFVVFADLEGKGMTAFIVERDSEGLSTGAEEKKMGIKGSSTVNLILENVSVPKDNVLGNPGEGHLIALNILNVGRFKLGAADLGGCKACVNHATRYALERIQFGQPIAFFQAIRKKLADMIVRTYVLDSVIYRTVGLMDERIADLATDDPDYNRKVMGALEEYAIEASISKILGSETLFRVSDHGIQIYGGYGFSEDYPIAAVFRDTRIDRIFEGTNEINRMVIYGYFLKKALMEELPFRTAATVWDEPETVPEGPLQWEIHALDVVRRCTVRCVHDAISLYGQDLRNEQVVGEDLADLIIGYYGASTAINRLVQLGDEALRSPALRALGRLVAASYLEDAARLHYRLRPVLFSNPQARPIGESIARQMQDLVLPFDPVKEMHVLTDDLLDCGHYRFE